MAYPVPPQCCRKVPKFWQIYKGGNNSYEKLEKVPEFTDINISDVICRNAKIGIAASGIEGLNCVHGITISNSTIVYDSKATEIDEKTAQVKLVNVNLVPNKK